MRWGRDGETNVIFEGRWRPLLSYEDKVATLSFIDEGERAKFLDLRRREGEPSLHLRGREGEPSFYFRRDGGKPSTIYGIKSFLIFMNVKN